MTTMQLNAELFRELSIIADDENLMKKALKSIRRLAEKKQAMDETELSHEEFCSRIEQARKDIAEGKGRRFSNVEELDKYIRSL